MLAPLAPHHLPLYLIFAAVAIALVAWVRVRWVRTRGSAEARRHAIADRALRAGAPSANPSVPD